MEKFKSYLQKIAHISEEDWNLVLPLCKAETIKKGAFFVDEGDYCNKVAFIDSGLFKLYYLLDGQEKIMLFFTEGHFISDYYSFLTKTPSVRPIQALEDSHIYSISYEQLQILYHQSKGWEKIGRIFAEHSYVYAVQRSNRLIHDDFDTRFKTFMEEYPTLMQRVPQFMIASYLNMTPETFSRIKRRLYKKELQRLQSIHKPLSDSFL